MDILMPGSLRRSDLRSGLIATKSSRRVMDCRAIPAKLMWIWLLLLLLLLWLWLLVAMRVELRLDDNEDMADRKLEVTRPSF